MKIRHVLIGLLFATTILWAGDSNQAYAACGYGVTTALGDACSLDGGEQISSGYVYCDGRVALCCESRVECDERLGIFPGPDNEFFDDLNPLISEELGGTPEVGSQLQTPGAIVSKVLKYALPLAGMILFLMLVWGGFEILAGSATKKSMDAGKQRITAAIVGFILLFVSFWIMQILEIMFGISIV